jgi:hypothetical protein
VVQNTAAADAAFGVAEIDGALFALAFNSDDRLSSAVLIARDPERMAHPIDFTAGGLLAPPGRDGASAWGAPMGQDRRFVAQDRLAADAAAALAPSLRRSGARLCVLPGRPDLADPADPARRRRDRTARPGGRYDRHHLV